VSEQDCRAFA